MYRFLVSLIPVLLLSSCTPKASEILPLRFAAYWGEQAIGCGSPVGTTQLTDLRFYLSELEFHSVDDGRMPAGLADNGRWQGNTIALVDLEDGTESCVNGTPDDNPVVLARVPAGKYRGLQFVVGVPFALNHGDPLQALAPLDDSTMHWHWRSGYKFLRAGVVQGGTPFLLHLGSAACEGTVAAIRGCRYPNRVVVVIDEWQPEMTIAVDLRVLVESAVVPDGDAICESAPADPDCTALEEVLGLGPGSSEPAGRQQLFRARIL